MPTCNLIGIYPPSDELLPRLIRERLARIRWGNRIAVVGDPDRDGAPTLLMTYLSEDGEDGREQTDPMDIVGAINKEALEGKDATCELWATAPAPIPLPPAGGYGPLIEIRARDLEDWRHRASRAVSKYGIVAQRNVLGSSGDHQASVLRTLRKVVDGAVDRAMSALSEQRPSVHVGRDPFVYREIASRNLERFDLRLEDTPGAKECIEEHVLGNPRVRSLLQETLGSYPEEIDYDVGVVFSRPGAVDQTWHADGKHIKGNGSKWEGWGLEAEEENSDEDENEDRTRDVYALCLFLPLIDLDHKVGYTQFWPCSHRHRELLGFGKVAELTNATYEGICNAGDGVWYDYRLMHRGMRNVSTNVVRPVMQVIFKKKWYIERDNYGVESIYR